MSYERNNRSCRCKLCKAQFEDGLEKYDLGLAPRPGEVDFDELCWLNLFPNPERIEYLRTIRDTTPYNAVIVEIGSHVGFVSNVLAADARTVFCVDVWEDFFYNDEDGAAGGIVSHNTFLGGWPVIFNRFALNAGRKLYSQIIPIRMPSEIAAENFPFEVDMVYIDGAHDYENVKKDIKSWWSKVKTGGVMVGDDYHAPGVTRAVNEFFGDINPEFGQWMVKKQ